MSVLIMGVGAALGGALGGLGVWGLRRFFRRSRARRSATREHLIRIAAGLPLRDIHVESIPTVGLRGRLHGYAIMFDGVPREDDAWLWRIHTELEHLWNGRLLLHGDDRPSRLKEIYGTTLVLTGDAAFDRHVITMATDSELALRVLSTYVRGTLLDLPHLHVQLDINGQHAYAECVTSAHGVRDLKHVIEAFVLVCATIDMGLRT